MDWTVLMIAVGEIAKQMIADGMSIDDARQDLEDAVEQVFTEIQDGDA